jgi:uncharacterized membrane protein
MAMSFANRIPSLGVSGLRGLLLAPVILTLLFLALPWSVAHKAHVLLHGLCAQNPEHTYALGGQLLPFDARMTGIYTGYLITTGVLFASGAGRRCQPPSLSRLLMLFALGGIMAADGLNSMLGDFGLPQVYGSQNWLRLVTGASAGVVLGAALCFLSASSLWRAVDPRRQTLQDLRVLPVIAVVWLPLGLLVISGWSVTFVPLTLLLILSAALALTNLALVVLVLLRRREFSFTDANALSGYGLTAVALALAAMTVLSVGRTLLERSLGTAPVT